MARDFLAVIAPDGDFTFQTFDDGPNNRPELRRIVHGPDWQALRVLHDAGAATFSMVNRGDGCGRKIENVIEVRALFADFDGASPDAAITALLPHAVVETSPRKFHVYWRCADCPLGKFSAVQKAIAARWGSDPVVNDLPRVMRLPGTLHRKSESFRVRLAAISPHHPYTLAEIVDAMKLRLQAPVEQHHAPLPQITGLNSPYATAALERASHAIATAPNGRQNFTLNREAFSIGQLVAGKLIGEGDAKRTLTAAASQMPDYDARRPWRTVEIERLIARCFVDAAGKPRRS